MRLWFRRRDVAPVPEWLEGATAKDWEISHLRRAWADYQHALTPADRTAAAVRFVLHGGSARLVDDPRLDPRSPA